MRKWGYMLACGVALAAASTLGAGASAAEVTKNSAENLAEGIEVHAITLKSGNFASARVDPGKPYRHVMIYRLSTSRRTK